MNEQTQIKSKSDDDDWSGTFTACCIISGAIGSVIYGVVGALIGHSASHEPPVNLNTAINSALLFVGVLCNCSETHFNEYLS